MNDFLKSQLIFVASFIDHQWQVTHSLLPTVIKIQIVQEKNLIRGQHRQGSLIEEKHFLSASLVSLVTNLEASGSLGSLLLRVALTCWLVKKPTQRLILWATKGQMKPQLARSRPGKIPTSFCGALGKCLGKKLAGKTKGVLLRLDSMINFENLDYFTLESNKAVLCSLFFFLLRSSTI